MQRFSDFLKLTETWFPLRTGERTHSGDSIPRLTSSGDYIVYHGTSMANARKIFKEKILRHDDMGTVGISTTPSRADIYGVMKSKRGNPSAVLRLVIDKAWLDSQDITREVGGSGRDQFLVHVDYIPSEVIKDMQLARVSGSPLKQGSLEYQDLP